MPMLDSYLMVITHARNQTLKLVADLSDEQMVIQPAPKTNHAAWVLGHLLLADCAFLNLVTGEAFPSYIDDAWRAVYGGGSTPESDKTKYRSKAFYIEKLAETREKIIAGLKKMTPADFGKEHPDPKRRERFPTIGHAIMFYGTWHESYHSGQLSTWRRVQGLPPV